MTPNDIKAKIEALSENTKANVTDTTGTGDHFSAVVVSDQFNALSTIKRHQLVFSILKSDLDSGELHALELKTYTPEEKKEKV